MRTVTISKMEYDRMKEEIEKLKKGSLYKRLLQFEQNLVKGKQYSRQDLGF